MGYVAGDERAGGRVALGGVHQVGIGGEHVGYAVSDILEVELHEVILGARALCESADVGRSRTQQEVAEMGFDFRAPQTLGGGGGEMYVRRKIGHRFSLPFPSPLTP